MKKVIVLFLLSGILLSSCFSAKIRKSEDYYFENRPALETLLKDYEALYRKQPFAIGFSDKRFSYYTIIMYTDSVRYLYNTHMNRKLVFDEMRQSSLTVEDLTGIARQIKDLKCLWIGKNELYIDNRKTMATNLSFKSQLFNRPFEENKYYILSFLETRMSKAATTRRLRKYGYHEVGRNVYFTISNRFR